MAAATVEIAPRALGQALGALEQARGWALGLAALGQLPLALLRLLASAPQQQVPLRSIFLLLFLQKQNLVYRPRTQWAATAEIVPHWTAAPSAIGVAVQAAYSQIHALPFLPLRT